MGQLVVSSGSNFDTGSECCSRTGVEGEVELQTVSSSCWEELLEEEVGMRGERQAPATSSRSSSASPSPTSMSRADPLQLYRFASIFRGWLKKE